MDNNNQSNASPLGLSPMWPEKKISRTVTLGKTKTDSIDQILGALGYSSYNVFMDQLTDSYLSKGVIEDKDLGVVVSVQEILAEGIKKPSELFNFMISKSSDASGEAVQRLQKVFQSKDSNPEDPNNENQ